MKTSGVPTSSKKPAVVLDKRQLEVQFGSKKTRYTMLKKTLAGKEVTIDRLSYSQISTC